MDAAAKLHTTAEIEALPEGRRMELIDGVLYDMAAPGLVHQKIVAFLTADLIHYVRSQNGNCQVFPAPFGVWLNADEYNYVEPDISVICDPVKLNEKGCAGAPDFIAEIVSPASRKKDYLTKLFKYRSAGVREYWIIDPGTHTTQTYWFEREEDLSDFNLYTFEESVPVHIWKAMEIRIADYLKNEAWRAR